MPREGLAPSMSFPHKILSLARLLNFATAAYVSQPNKASAGFAPANGSFADSCVSYFATTPKVCAGQTTVLAASPRHHFILHLFVLTARLTAPPARGVPHPRQYER